MFYLNECFISMNVLWQVWELQGPALRVQHHHAEGGRHDACGQGRAEGCAQVRSAADAEGGENDG